MSSKNCCGPWLLYCVLVVAAIIVNSDARAEDAPAELAIVHGSAVNYGLVGENTTSVTLEGLEPDDPALAAEWEKRGPKWAWSWEPPNYCNVTCTESSGGKQATFFASSTEPGEYNVAITATGYREKRLPPAVSWEGYAWKTGKQLISFVLLRVELKSVEFTTDHHVMRDYDEDETMGDNPPLFDKPEWVSGVRNNPISHTMDQNLGVKVVVKVEPVNVQFQLNGDGGEEQYASFSSEDIFTSTGNDQQIAASAQMPLPNFIIPLSSTISWSINGVDVATSGPHPIYVTASVPWGSVPTKWRIDRAVRICSHKANQAECIPVLQGAVRFNLHNNLDGEDAQWSAAAGVACDCISQVKFFMRSLVMLGFSDCGRACLLFPLTGKQAKAVNLSEYNAATSPQSRADGARLGYRDRDGRFNAAEATLLFGGRYYLGGKKLSVTTVQEGMEAVCERSCWQLPDGTLEDAEDWPLEPAGE